MNKLCIRKIYLYVFSCIGLILVIFGSVSLVSLGLKTFIFPGADKFYSYPLGAELETEAPMMMSETRKRPTTEEMEKYENNQRSANHQREVADALAMVIVGLPLYWYHWKRIKKDEAEEIARVDLQS